MAQKAIAFDSSRCTGCQACAAACGRVRRSPLPYANEGDGEGSGDGNAVAADAYERAADVDGAVVLAVTLRERTVEPHGLVWEIGRKSCVHCATAPCAEVCPTGALSRDEQTGLVVANDGCCVSCFLCSLACPGGVPQPGGAGGAVSKCDGCIGRARSDLPPFCVEACPLDALAWGDREEMIVWANERAAQLRERGYERASVLGVSEQGGHGVIQVLKYGVEGSELAPFAATGEMPWVAGVKMAGPVSVGVLGALGAAAVGTLAWETHKEQRARAMAKAAPITVVPGIAAASEAASARGESEVPMSGVPDGESCANAELEAIEEGYCGESCERDAYLDGDFTEEDAAWEAEERAAREAVEDRARARAAAPHIVAPTPAAAAAATAVESHLYPVSFDGDGDDYDDFDSIDVDEGDSFPEACIVDEPGDTGEIPVVDELGDTGEIPVIDGEGDTGELYNLEDFRRLLAADIVAHHLAREGARESISESDQREVRESTSELARESVQEPDRELAGESTASQTDQEA